MPDGMAIWKAAIAAVSTVTKTLKRQRAVARAMREDRERSFIGVKGMPYHPPGSKHQVFVRKNTHQRNHTQQSGRDELEWKFEPIAFMAFARAHEIGHKSDHSANSPGDGYDLQNNHISKDALIGQ